MESTYRSVVSESKSYPSSFKAQTISEQSLLRALLCSEKVGIVILVALWAFKRFFIYKVAYILISATSVPCMKLQGFSISMLVSLRYKISISLHKFIKCFHPLMWYLGIYIYPKIPGHYICFVHICKYVLTHTVWSVCISLSQRYITQKHKFYDNKDQSTFFPFTSYT